MLTCFCFIDLHTYLLTPWLLPTNYVAMCRCSKKLMCCQAQLAFFLSLTASLHKQLIDTCLPAESSDRSARFLCSRHKRHLFDTCLRKGNPKQVSDSSVYDLFCLYCAFLRWEVKLAVSDFCRARPEIKMPLQSISFDHPQRIDDVISKLEGTVASSAAAE